MCARHWKGIGRRRCNLIYRKNRVTLKSVFAAEQISQQENKIIACKSKNRAFRKAPPICRKASGRKGEFGARIYNNFARKQNRAFAQRTPVCKHLCFRDEGEFFAIYNVCALKKAKKREKPPPCRLVSPLNHEK